MATIQDVIDKLDKFIDNNREDHREMFKTLTEHTASIACLKAKWSGIRWLLGGLFFPVIVALVLTVVL